MNAVVLGLSATALGVVSGLLWMSLRFSAIDANLALKVNRLSLPRSADEALRRLGILGTQWLLLAAVVAAVLAAPELGLPMAAAAAGAVALAKGLKYILRRPRPFVVQPAITVRQVNPPQDPSFPSADAMRIWFLVASMAFGLALPAAVVAAGILAAASVSFGRLRFGVHYPLDVWAGSWLGFGAGGIWVDLVS